MSKLITVMLASALGIALNTASAQNVDSDKYKQQDQGQSQQQQGAQDSGMDRDQSTTGAAGGRQDDSSGMRLPDDSSNGTRQAPQIGQPDSDPSQYRR
jgi:hypothetical protein